MLAIFYRLSLLNKLRIFLVLSVILLAFFTIGTKHTQAQTTCSQAFPFGNTITVAPGGTLTLPDAYTTISPNIQWVIVSLDCATTLLSQNTYPSGTTFVIPSNTSLGTHHVTFQVLDSGSPTPIWTEETIDVQNSGTQFNCGSVVAQWRIDSVQDNYDSSNGTVGFTLNGNFPNIDQCGRNIAASTFAIIGSQSYSKADPSQVTSATSSQIVLGARPVSSWSPGQYTAQIEVCNDLETNGNCTSSPNITTVGYTNAFPIPDTIYTVTAGASSIQAGGTLNVVPGQPYIINLTNGFATTDSSVFWGTNFTPLISHHLGNTGMAGSIPSDATSGTYTMTIMDNSVGVTSSFAFVVNAPIVPTDTIAPPTPTSIQSGVTVTAPSCILPNDSGSDITVSWTVPDVFPGPEASFLDITTDSSFTTYFHKAINIVTSGTTSPTHYTSATADGLYASTTFDNVPPYLTYQPDTTYYARYYNGTDTTPVSSFSIPPCGPTLTTNPNAVTFNFAQLYLDDIGLTGDNANPFPTISLSPTPPNNPSRNVSVGLFVNEDDPSPAAVAQGTVTYNGSAGDFTGNASLDNAVNGDYYLKILSPGYLWRKVPNVQTIQIGSSYTLPKLSLIAGDIDGDNKLSVSDYNILLDCGYNDVNPLPMNNAQSTFTSADCQAHAQAGVRMQNIDIDDNGIINHQDETVFEREISVQAGD